MRRGTCGTVAIACVLLALCAGCTWRWRPAPGRSPEAELRLRQLAKIVADRHPEEPESAALSVAIGVPGTEVDAEDGPALATQVRADTDAEHAARLNWERGAGAREPSQPSPPVTGAWLFARWVTRWTVGIAVALGLLLILLGRRGAKWLRNRLARGAEAWRALVAVSGRVDAIKADMGDDEAKVLNEKLGAVPAEVKAIVREARMAAGTHPSATASPEA